MSRFMGKIKVWFELKLSISQRYDVAAKKVNVNRCTYRILALNSAVWTKNCGRKGSFGGHLLTRFPRGKASGAMTGLETI